MKPVDKFTKLELIQKFDYDELEIDTGAVIAVSEFLPDVDVIQKLDVVRVHETDEEAAKYYTEVTGNKYFTIPGTPFGHEEFYLDTQKNRASVKKALARMGIAVA